MSEKKKPKKQAPVPKPVQVPRGPHPQESRQKEVPSKPNGGGPRPNTVGPRPSTTRPRPSTGDSDKDVCIVCYRRQPETQYYSTGSCDHAVCFECSARMRVLMDQKECAACRQVLENVWDLMFSWNIPNTTMVDCQLI
jgi:hypothetical protein